MTASKPVIRKRNGRWICRGQGRSGSSRSPVAAYYAWIVAGSVGDAAYSGYRAMRKRST
jgi:hypothetical protein